MNAKTPLTSETIELLNNRVSIRKYTDAPVDAATVDAILAAAFRAPTSSNFQAYSVVIVSDPATRERLTSIAGGQKHILTAPLFLAFCADLSRVEMVAQSNAVSIDDNNMELGLVASIDASLVGMSAYLAAESLGLRGVMIGALRNDPLETASLLCLPHRSYCVFGMCLGWPDEAPQQKPRMALGAIAHPEQYGAGLEGQSAEAALANYNSSLADHYTSVGRPTTPDSWSRETVTKICTKQRDGLRDQLKQLGFDFR